MTLNHNFRELLGSDDAYDALMDFIFYARQHGSFYSGMTYEDGLLSIIDLLEGNEDVQDIIGDFRTLSD